MRLIHPASAGDLKGVTCGLLVAKLDVIDSLSKEEFPDLPVVPFRTSSRSMLRLSSRVLSAASRTETLGSDVHCLNSGSTDHGYGSWDLQRLELHPRGRNAKKDTSPKSRHPKPESGLGWLMQITFVSNILGSADNQEAFVPYCSPMLSGFCDVLPTVFYGLEG